MKRRLATCSATANTVTVHLPVSVGDFSDFSCSLHHGLNASEAVMGVRSEAPGFRHFPIRYAGRASTIVPSGTPVHRPLGQYRSTDGITFGESKALDFELEVGCIIGKASTMASRVSVEDADDHIFGFVLVNDWSGMQPW